MPNFDTPLSAAEAAVRSGEPKRTVLHAIKTGKLPAQKMENGYHGVYLIALADLERWMADRPDRAQATA